MRIDESGTFNKTSIYIFLQRLWARIYLSQKMLDQRILQINIIPWLDRLLCSYEYEKQGVNGSVLRQTVTSYSDINFVVKIHTFDIFLA